MKIKELIAQGYVSGTIAKCNTMGEFAGMKRLLKLFSWELVYEKEEEGVAVFKIINNGIVNWCTLLCQSKL